MASVVTGAFGYIGKYITRFLLDAGEEVRTITTHPDKPNPFGRAVQAFPLDFGNPALIVRILRGAATLYNTYWVRFERGRVTFKQAIANTELLFGCAKEAGVQRIVHISVTSASPESPLPYYSGKGLQELALKKTGMPYSIIRPTLVFGKEDILVNNIAWLIRKFPVFPIFGDGTYRVQPVFVEDVAALAITSAQALDSVILDAVGPETFSFAEFVSLIASRVKPGVRLLHVPPSLGLAFGSVIGKLVRDRLLTRDELRGLMDGLLASDAGPRGTTPFSQWLDSNTDTIGRTYSSELDRHFRWKATTHPSPGEIR